MNKVYDDLWSNSLKSTLIDTYQAKLPWWKTLYLGILAGAYIGFGCALALSVGGAVPGIIGSGALGVQKMMFGAFGLPFGTNCKSI